LTRLEIQLQDTRTELEETKAELKEMEVKMAYYDRLALKWGGACMGALALGAAISGHFEKICNKIWALLVQ